MKLKVLGNYQNRDVSFAKGNVIDVDTEYAHFLLTDAPGCFKVDEPVKPENPEKQEPGAETKAIDAPPKTTMVKRAKVTK